jgi:hypothetical protein
VISNACQGRPGRARILAHLAPSLRDRPTFVSTLKVSSCSNPAPVAAALALALAVAACGVGSSAPLTTAVEPVAGPPVALGVGAAQYLPGEVMRFELSLRGVVGGAATIVVGEPGRIEGREVIVVRSRTRSAGVARLFKVVQDDVTTWIDRATGRPLRLEADVKFGDKEARIETAFAGGDPGPFTIRYARRYQPTRRLRQLMPPGEAALDGHSVLGALRGWDAAAGAQAFFHVLAGRRLWHNQITFAGTERVTTSLGRFTARRIDAVAWRLDTHLRRMRNKKPRHYSIWVSDDERRLPIRIEAKTEYGAVKVELVSHEIATLQAAN